MLNLDRLRALHAVADRGSLMAAADALHVTNSAISQQLAKLEDEVGQPLLERNGRGVRLTDAAMVLVAHTARALSVLEQAEAEIDQQRTELVGRLSIAAFPTAMRGLAPAALNHIRVAHPKLDVVVHEQEPHESIPLLARGDLNLLIAQDWVNQPLALPDGLSRAPLMDDVADVALPAGHPLADQPAVTLEQLADQRWIVWQPGTVCHDWLMHTLRTQGYEPIIAHTAGEHATQLALVAAGLGAAVIPRLGRGRVPDGVRMVPVRPSLHRQIYALWRTQTSRPRAVQAAVAAFQISASPTETRAARPSSGQSSRTPGGRSAARTAPREK